MMRAKTHDLPLPFWADNLEELDGEIARLSMLCDIRILETRRHAACAAERRLGIGTDNRVAFAKLRPC